MEDTYEKAYKEVIELLKYFPRESVEKIPKEELELYKKNMDNTYEYEVDKTKPFNEQKMSDKTKAIFAIIFRDYWASEYQRERILAKEKYDLQKLEEERRKKYNPDDIFKDKEIKDTQLKQEDESKGMILVNEEKWYNKIFNKIKSLFKRNK